MVSEKTIVVKLGGDILEKQENLDFTLSQFNMLLSQNIIENLIIVPGGGSRANFVRSLDKQFNLGDDLAHWMAIYAMECNGMDLNQRYSYIRCHRDIVVLKSGINNQSIRGLSVFLPYTFLTEQDELPHSWDVTSDSITIFLASKIGLRECYLIKNIDGIFFQAEKNDMIKKHISTFEFSSFKNRNEVTQLKKEGKPLKNSAPIDKHALRLIDRHNISCVLINGSPPNARIFDFFTNKDSPNTLYTQIDRTV